MNEQRAIKYLKHMLEMMATEPPENLKDDRDIREWEDEHKNIRETLEISFNALEKQIPKKHHHTRIDNINDKVRVSVCPCCLGIIYTHREEYPNYCSNCSQKLDWSE